MRTFLEVLAIVVGVTAVGWIMTEWSKDATPGPGVELERLIPTGIVLANNMSPLDASLVDENPQQPDALWIDGVAVGGSPQQFLQLSMTLPTGEIVGTPKLRLRVRRIGPNTDVDPTLVSLFVAGSGLAHNIILSPAHVITATAGIMVEFNFPASALDDLSAGQIMVGIEMERGGPFDNPANGSIGAVDILLRVRPRWSKSASAGSSWSKGGAQVTTWAKES